MSEPRPVDPASPDTDREALRAQWLRHAAAAFDLLFDPVHQRDLRSLHQREQRACEVMADLRHWLLQSHLQADPEARPDPAAPPRCPRCGQPAKPREGPGHPPPSRQVTTDAGEVHFQRCSFRCTTCRVVFFPPGPEAGAGAGGL